MKAFLFGLTISFTLIHAATYYVSPNGTGNGTSESSPLGSLSAGMSAIGPGDTLILLDGEYKETLNLNKSGTADSLITIMAKNIGSAFINGEGVRYPVSAWQKSYINLDGIKAGNSHEHVYHILYCDHFNITRCAGFNAGGALDPTANFHVFEIAYSDSMLLEDVWGWGTGRYTCTIYGCHGCTIRRGVFRPGLYQRCPHAGLAVYCTDHSLAENVIVFEARVDPASTYGAPDPWKLIVGGFVCEGHDCPNNKSSKNNRIYGCIGIDNGQHWDTVPRTQPAGCFIWNEYQGEFEDIVLWKNADKAFSDFTHTSTMPTRSLEGDPANVIKNTGPNILKRYVDGQLTGIDLWPWPYEEIIKQDLGMNQTITEYVRDQLDPYIVIPDISVEDERNRIGDTGIVRVFPNPFRGTIAISCQLSAVSKKTVPIKIYGMNGKMVKSLITDSRKLTAGITWNPERIQSGIYLLKIESGKECVLKKLIHVK
jgi:hypothetical protein